MSSERTNRGVSVKPTGKQGKKPAKSPAASAGWGLKVAIWGLGSLLVAGAVGAGGVAGLFWYWGQDLPDIRTLQDYRPAQTTRVYAADGQVIATIVGDDLIRRTVLPFDEIPMVMRKALLAAEDANFYEHEGVDYMGLVRAVVRNLQRGKLGQGASTITQQVVKNLILTPERTIKRKIQEAQLAVKLDRYLRKDDILAIYLNEVFFGAQAYGVEEASRFYFGHGASALTLDEAALLAGLVQSPNRYNPFKNLEAALGRRRYVLGQMKEKGFITAAEWTQASEAKVTLVDPAKRDGAEGAAPDYVVAVREWLDRELGKDKLLGAGWSIYTPLDLDLQRASVAALRKGLSKHDAEHGLVTPKRTLVKQTDRDKWLKTAKAEHLNGDLKPGKPAVGMVDAIEVGKVWMRFGPEVRLELKLDPLIRFAKDEADLKERFPVGGLFTVVRPVGGPVGDDAPVRLAGEAEGAIVAIDPATRAVRAIVGGYQVSGSGFQRAISAQRQMGSSFKVLVYAQLLASRTATAATIYADQPASFVIDGSTTWRPKNYDGSFKGLMSVRTALAQSRNVIAVRALEQATIPAVISLAKSIGFTSGLTNNLTLSLGSAEASPLVATNAFATFAAGGSYEPPVFVTEIRGPRQLGDDGASTVFQHAAAPVRAIDPAVAWLTTSLMRSVVEEGTATHAKRLKVEIAGKTGTTNDARDAWFIGFTSDLVMGVWLGRDDNGPLGRGATGGGSAVPIWTEAMRAAIEQRRPPAFAAAPEGIVSAVVDTATGMLVSAETKRKRTEFFLAGTEPTEAGSTAGDPSVNDLILQGGAVQGSGEQVEPDDGF